MRRWIIIISSLVIFFVFSFDYLFIGSLRQMEGYFIGWWTSIIFFIAGILVLIFDKEP